MYSVKVSVEAQQIVLILLNKAGMLDIGDGSFRQQERNNFEVILLLGLPVAAFVPVCPTRIAFNALLTIKHFVIQELHDKKQKRYAPFLITSDGNEKVEGLRWWCPKGKSQLIDVYYVFQIIFLIWQILTAQLIQPSLYRLVRLPPTRGSVMVSVLVRQLNSLDYTWILSVAQKSSERLCLPLGFVLCVRSQGIDRPRLLRSRLMFLLLRTKQSTCCRKVRNVHFYDDEQEALSNDLLYKSMGHCQASQERAKVYYYDVVGGL